MLFSSFESDFLGLRIGRYNEPDLDSRLIAKAMETEHLDICLIKISAKTTNLNEKLYQLKLPFYYSTGILNYEMRFFELEPGPYLNSEIVFETVTENHAAILHDLIKSSFANDPIGYHKIPNCNKYFSKEQEAECMAQWHVNLINSEDHLMIVSKINEEYNGFISIYKSGEDAVICPVAGVSNDWRGKGVFHDLRTFRHRYCLEKNIPIGLAGARLGNFYSQKLFIGDGMTPTKTNLVFFVTRQDF